MMETSNRDGMMIPLQDAAAGPMKGVLARALAMPLSSACLASGKHTKSDWTWSFIVDFVIQNGDFPKLC